MTPLRILLFSAAATAFAATAPEPPKLRLDSSVLVIEYGGSLPISPSWLFAEARLPRADRQRALDRLDARSSRAH